MKPADLEVLSSEALATATGGMRWEQFRRSTNVEDRRSPAAIRRDQEWWDRTQRPSTPDPMAPTSPGPTAPIAPADPMS
ncbi:MAG: hypothetical protein ACTHU0_25410 [Kofleriaceae bacterium]